jgi:hypothetical protein
MVKKTKKPVKNGKRKVVIQKQKQSIVVNINTRKTRISRQPLEPSKPKRIPQYITTYPVFMESQSSPPIIYNRPEPLKVHEPEPVKKTTIEPVIIDPFTFKTPVKKTPVKKTPLKHQSKIPVAFPFIPKTVRIRIPKKTPIEPTVNMTDIYDVPDFIPESTYKSQEKTSPREPLNLEKFMTDINELSVVVDDEKMKQNKKNYKAKEKRIDKKFSYVR